MVPASRRYLLLRLLLPAVFVFLACTPNSEPMDSIQAMGLGDTLTPGSRTAFVLAMVTPRDPDERADRTLTVELALPDGESSQVFRGQTDANGLLPVEFDVPDDATDLDALIMVYADFGGNMVSTGFPVYLGETYDVMLSTDKPVYQPGQTIHMRALALARSDLVPAQDEAVTFTVSDPLGNKLLVEDVPVSSYGVAALDYPLDARATSGDYVLEAALGSFRISDSVEVKPYVLPRFEVTFETAQSYYLPGEVVTGTVRAAYFFGKPVAGGEVTLKGFVTDVERVEAVTLSGVTDDAGEYAFEFTVPETFVADVIEDRLGQRTATLEIELEVEDTAAHSERIEEEITVAEGRILIDVEAEAGDLIAGADNLVFVSTQAPGGAALPAHVTLTGGDLEETIELTTDENGLAVFTLPAAEVDSGRVGGVRFRVEAQSVADPAITSARTSGIFIEDGLLLRPDRSEYAVGDTMLVDIYAPEGVAPVYLSIEKNGESHALATLPVGMDEEGREVAQAAIELDGALLGTLQVRAFGRGADGEIFEAMRYVLVNPAPAELAVETGAESYRPGESAVVTVQMSQDGEPLQGALGISIVDESVFALGDSEPGFLRTYFLVARSLSGPRYTLDEFVDLESDDPSPYDIQSPGEAHDPRQVALGGYFAQELAARSAPAAQAPARSPLWAYLSRASLALPLLGLALFDGTRRRLRLLIGLVVAGLAALVLVSCAMSPAAPAAPAAEAPAAEAPADATTATRGEGAPPRLRQFFPETLFWLPELETDADGRAQIEVPLADSITTWRVSLVAHDRDGSLGSATAGLRVFQEFFVEPDLPTHLTVGDEVAVPVSLYNYLDQPQEVTLSVEPAAWFTFTEAPDLTVALAANEVAAAYLPIRVLEFGEQSLQITALGDTLSDAVLREVTVVPDGEPLALVENGVVQDGARLTVRMPESSAPAASGITVKLYPGRLSRAVEGMEKMLTWPHGCFEQVTSVTYPNVLILDYLRRSGQSNAGVERMAQDYIRSGYQQLVAYEVRSDPGGFSYWGDPPPLFWLTAYGLMEFSDMERVSYVDPRLIERTATYLRERQQGDGSWLNEQAYGEPIPIETTAYVVWALANAGYAEAPEVQRGLDFLRAAVAAEPVGEQPDSPLTEGVSGQSTQGMPRPGGTAPGAVGPRAGAADPYRLALIANAFLAAGEDATPLLDALVELAEPSGAAGAGLRWTIPGATLTGSWDWSASQETTALAAHAFLMADYRTDVGRQAIDHLLAETHGSSALATTQATVFLLKAMLAEVAAQEDEGATTITFTLDGQQEQSVLLEPGQGTIETLRFEGVAQGPHALEMHVDGSARPELQVIVEYYEPWSLAEGRTNEAAAISVTYDRTDLAVNETVQAVARVDYRAAEPANMLLVELGVPPGFTVLREEWDDLVDEGVISRYEVGFRYIRVYLADVAPGATIELTYRLQARLPLIAQTPPSRAYDYYSPDRQGLQPPERITVRIRG